MGKNKVSSALIVCIAVGLLTVISITAVAINGVLNNGNSLSAPSETTSSEEAPSSSETPSSSEAQVSSSSQAQVSSSSQAQVSSNSAVSSGSRPAKYPENDGEKICYLTFDDGPSSKVTTRILSTLEEYDVKATFFVVGTGKLSLLKDIQAAGHAIGLHTNTHEWDVYKSTDAYFADLQAISDKVYAETGIRSKIMRFPGGSSNKVSINRCPGIMSKLVNMVEDKGYVYFDWNVDSTDASRNNVPKSEIVNNVLKYAKNKDKICVLMHDTNAKSTTADALPEIIEGLKEMGFKFETLDQNSPIFHQKVNN